MGFISGAKSDWLAVVLNEACGVGLDPGRELCGD